MCGELENADAVMTGGARSTGISAVRLLRLRPWSFLLGAGAGQVDGLGPGSAGEDGRDRAKDGHPGHSSKAGRKPLSKLTAVPRCPLETNTAEATATATTSPMLAAVMIPAAKTSR